MKLVSPEHLLLQVQVLVCNVALERFHLRRVQHHPVHARHATKELIHHSWVQAHANNVLQVCKTNETSHNLGTFADTTGATQCTSCPRGTYSPSAGAQSNSSCIPCALGYASIQEGASSCQACLPGYYSESLVRCYLLFTFIGSTTLQSMSNWHVLFSNRCYKQLHM